MVCNLPSPMLCPPKQPSEATQSQAPNLAKSYCAKDAQDSPVKPEDRNLKPAGQPDVTLTSSEESADVAKRKMHGKQAFKVCILFSG